MNDIEEKIYSGVLGKAIGVRLGAPIEPYQWDYERIKNSFGEIRTYLKKSERFAADDDTNGPVFFIRSLNDADTFEVSAEAVGKSWLNYARDGQGMFWWGGEGISTEHTAYSNLKKGFTPPVSGSEALNTKSLSEQVGGQIFIDSWGLINPGNISKALSDAGTAASVSHDGEAVTGAQFIAGLIAGAFIENNIVDLFDRVLEKLPQDGEYYRVLKDVRSFHEKKPGNFRDAYQYVLENYSYDHYEGACHVIPNACIVAIGLLYCENNFSRSIEITCMCGWDTDSNAGVVGTIMGVLCGLDEIPDHYRDPINDIIVGSSMSPTLNTINIPDFAQMLFNLSRKTFHEKENVSLHFPFKGSTCGLQINNDFRVLKDRITRNSRDGFNVLIDNLIQGDEASIFYQTFYQTKDFGDNRYDPVFAPLVYSGQIFSANVVSFIDFIDDLNVAPYVKCANGEVLEGDFVLLPNKQKKRVEFKIPDTKGSLIKEIGLKIKTNSQPIDGNGLLGRLKIEAFSIKGSSSFRIDSSSFEEGFLGNVAPFSNHRIKTALDNKVVRFNSLETDGVSITGDYYTKDFSFNTTYKNIIGDNLTLPFRVKGLENYYLVRIKPDSVSIEHRLDQKNAVLEKESLVISFDQDINVELEVRGNHARVVINNHEVMSSDGMDNKYGHFGVGANNSSFEIEEIEINTF